MDLRILDVHAHGCAWVEIKPDSTQAHAPELTAIYELEVRSNLGHALETVVLLELLRNGAELGYLRTSNGHEVEN
jgi:predicted AAA+ superfamily ATPase